MLVRLYLASLSLGPVCSFCWGLSHCLGPCFKKNTATLTIDGNSSALLVVDTEDKTSWFCDQGYIIGYVGAFDIRYFELTWFSHKITWEGNWLLMRSHVLLSFRRVVQRWTLGPSEQWNAIFHVSFWYCCHHRRNFWGIGLVIGTLRYSDCNAIFRWVDWCTCPRMDCGR